MIDKSSIAFWVGIAMGVLLMALPLFIIGLI